MAKTPEMIIDEDIKKIYLGNLNTVEFNLKLPKEGAQGTQITWSSDNELFLRPDGSVTRPVNGIGNRKVHLKGIFSYGGFKKEKIYEVHILEEQSRVDIAEDCKSRGTDDASPGSNPAGRQWTSFLETCGLGGWK